MKKFLSGAFGKFILSVGIAALLFFICPSCFNKTTLGIILGLLLIIINFSKFFSKYPWITHISRVLVGGLFIFSGFIKSNDPLGFSYKLEEYFEVFKADTGLSFFELFAHASLPLAITICVSEVALGFLLLIGSFRNITLYLLLAQIVFFTFLTFYSACYNKVTHCGCFGDFIQLTPWESFWKDIYLLVLITILLVGRENIHPIFKPSISNGLALLAILTSVWFPIHTFRNLPVFDFRAYAPGLSICEGMKPGKNFKPAVIKTMFQYKNKKSGELKAFDGNNLPWQDTLTWEYHDRLPDEIVSPMQDGPKITDFSISDLEGNSITDSILKIKDYHFIVVAYDLKKTETSSQLHAKINDFYELSLKNNILLLALTSSNSEQISNFKRRNKANYKFATSDGIVLKTMIRSNPGLILIKDCKVIANWHYNNWPSFTEVKNNYLK